MSGIANWLQANRVLRIIFVALSFPLPLANLLSGGMVVMTARSAGWLVAATDCLAAGLLLAIAVGLTGGPWVSAVEGAAALWGGALLGGHLLGRFGSVDLAVQALVATAVAGVLVASLFIPDARSHWLPILEKLFANAGLPQVEGLPADWLGTVAALMHGVIGASLLSSVFMALLLGSWLSAPAEGGEWRQRFLRLRLGRVLTMAAILAMAGLVAGLVGVGGSVLLVLGTGFVAQGLAVVHWTAERRAWPRVWPLPLYGVLLLSASLAGMLLVGLLVVGFVDNFFSLRRYRSDVV